MCLWFRNDKVGNGDYDVIMILRNVARGPFLIFLWAITVPFMFTHPSLCMYLTTDDCIKSYSCHVCWRPTSFPSIDRIITTIIIIIYPFQFKWRISSKWRAAHSLLVAAGVSSGLSAPLGDICTYHRAHLISSQVSSPHQRQSKRAILLYRDNEPCKREMRYDKGMGLGISFIVGDNKFNYRVRDRGL